MSINNNKFKLSLSSSLGIIHILPHEINLKDLEDFSINKKAILYFING